MLLEIQKIFIESTKRNRKYEKNIYIYKCDGCDVVFERKRKLKNKSNLLHFHSSECYQNSMKDGNARDYVKSKFDEEVKEKVKETFQRKYGVTSNFKRQEVRDRLKESILDKFGSTSCLGNLDIQKKKNETFKNKYGTETPISKCPTVVSKSIETLIERYGVDYIHASQRVQAYKETSIKNWGVEHPMKSHEVRSKINFKESWKKQHATKKVKGIYVKSHSEDRFFLALTDIFKEVERNVLVNNWSIDFYVRDLDFYVQFDGSYWHGLDRPIEKILASSNPRDRGIYETWKRDQEQNMWFQKSGMILHRISDVDFFDEEKRTSFFEMMRKTNKEPNL